MGPFKQWTIFRLHMSPLYLGFTKIPNLVPFSYFQGFANKQMQGIWICNNDKLWWMFSSYSIPEWLHFGKPCPTGQLQDQQQEVLNKKSKQKSKQTKQNTTWWWMDDVFLLYFTMFPLTNYYKKTIYQD